MRVYGFSFLAILVAIPALCAADPPSAKQVAKQKVEELNAALIKEDYAKVTDLTHPKVVELMGGREKMIAVMESGTKDMKAKGYSFRSVKVDEPGEPIAAGDERYVVVPFLLEMKAPGGRLLQKSFVIGVSGDAGKSWTFVNGDQQGEKLKKVLPNLPEDLKLPKPEKPVFEKE
jgi:hypothetical protein